MNTLGLVDKKKEQMFLLNLNIYNRIKERMFERGGGKENEYVKDS